MGTCSSSTYYLASPRYGIVKKNMNPGLVREGYEKKQSSLRKSVPAIEKESVRSDDFSSASSTTYTRTLDSIGRPASESSTSSVNSSTYSDSFDPKGLLSYDGLNKRATNRNDIGLEILKAKIELGADPKGLTTHGDRSCLMFAVIANDYNFTKKLVELGVDVNKMNRFGETALGLAMQLQRDKIASYLCSEGAK